MENSVSMNMRHFYSLSLIAISVALANPAYAQSKDAPPASEADTTITVTGTKAEKKEIRREARSFAGAMMAPILGQYSRRQSGICPLVIGIDQSYHKVIYAKIRSIASQIGAKVAGNNCKTNSFIIFSSNGVDTVAQLRKEQPPIFAEVPIDERSSLFKMPAPARWWYRTEVKDTEGRTFSGGLGLDSDDFPIVGSSNSAESLIYSTVQINLMASIVLIDLKKAEGYPLEAIAAHAAMVSLVQVKPGKDFTAVPSILNIFAPGKLAGDAPLDLTRWDYAFAQSIYEIKARQSGAAQKSELAQRIATKLSQ
jgi:hypothetical protein